MTCCAATPATMPPPTAQDAQQALERLLDYYQHTAARAEARLARQTRPGPRPPPRRGCTAAPDLDDDGQALAWARADRASLLACLDHAATAGQHARVIALTAGLAGLLRRDGPWADAITRHAAAAQAAQRLGDRLGQASALNDLGIVRRLTGDYPGAAQDLEQALGIYRDLGDRLGQANALSDLGIVRRLTGDYPAAAQALEQALGIYRDLGDRLGQANALSELGVVRRLTGDYPAAAQALEQALGIYRDLGDRLGQANALSDLGVVRRLTGDYPAAAQAAGAGPGHLPGPRRPGWRGRRRSMREGRCTGSAVSSRGLRGVTGRPWSWPALSPAPGTRLTRWPAWAAAPWPTATPPKPRSSCGRHWRYSSASAQPKPRTCSPN